MGRTILILFGCYGIIGCFWSKFSQPDAFPDANQKISLIGPYPLVWHRNRKFCAITHISERMVLLRSASHPHACNYHFRVAFSLLGICALMNVLIVNVFSVHVTTRSFLNLTVKRLWKSVHFCQSYRKNKWPTFLRQTWVFVRIIIWLKGSVKEPNMFHNYETEKVTRKASDVTESLQLYIELFGSSARDVMHDASFNVILWTSADICVVHDDLGWKNRTTLYNRFWRAGCSWLEYVDIRSVY